MKKIGSLLSYAHSLLKNAETIKKDLAMIVYSQSKIKVNSQQIKIKDSVVFLNLSPAEKSKIFIHKQRVMDEIKKNPGLKNIKNIF